MKFKKARVTRENNQLSFPIKSFIPFTELKEVENFLAKVPRIRIIFENK